MNSRLDASTDFHGAPPSGNGSGPRIERQLRLLTVRELAELPPAVPVVAGLIFADSLAVLVGAYASFKSFLALLLAVSVALGRECLGRATKQGAVVYVFAEGAHGIQSRMAALMAYLGVDDVPGLYFIPQAVLLNTPSGLLSLKQAIDRLPERPLLIVLDTVARTLHGSDSDTADVSGYVEATDAIRLHTQAGVLAVHHFGWEEKRSRGSTVLPCSADTELHLFRDGDRVRVHTEKQKDGPEAPDFTLEAVPFAGSLVLKPVGQDDSRLSENETACLEAVQAATTESGLTAGAIAKATKLQRSSTYNALNRLERLVYVRKRLKAYSTTEAGLAKLREMSNGQT